MSTLLPQLRLPRLKDYWMRLALRGVHYADGAGKLDFLYRVEDPWQMRSAREQARFDWSNGLIADRFAPLDTILEIGCGEGHQSQYLARQCRRLYGIDVSARAVERARRRCPEGRFAVGDPFGFAFSDAPPVFDLIVACEMLYYVKDIPRFLARLGELGRACLVTYYLGQAAGLAPHLAALPNAESANFQFGERAWLAVWWRGRGD